MKIGALQRASEKGPRFTRRGGLAATASVLFLLGLVLGWAGAVGLAEQETAEAPAPPMRVAKADGGGEDAGRDTEPARSSPPEPATAGDGHGKSPPAPLERYASPTPDAALDAPRVAIVIDDLGLNRARSERAIALDSAVTLAFLTYADGLAKFARQARSAGHELIVHVPMQPHDSSWDTGRNTLRANLPSAERARRLNWALQRFDGFIGVNNHMGSAFTENRGAMRDLLQSLRDRGLMFLDSRTTAKTVAPSLAAEIGLPFASRDVFLDNDKDAAAIRRNLDKTVRIARETGQAIAIGHPYPVTLEVLADWVPKARAQGVALVPLSAVIQRSGLARNQTAAKPDDKD